MSEFWKSIPKIYCKYCNVWYQDNKSSREFHERSFKHKSNIDRHIGEVQRRGVQQKRAENEEKAEMQRIERAAMAAYEKDLASSGKPSDLLATTGKSEAAESSSGWSGNQRSGEPKAEAKDEPESEKKSVKESDDLMRKQALESVTSKLKKKNEWFESKTVEGKVYYYNRTTLETRWTPPKSGFVSIEEQKDMNISDVPGDQSRSNDDSQKESRTFKHEQFHSKWQTVTDAEQSQLDLQLPKVQIKRKVDKDRDEETEKIEFSEKVLDKTLFKKKDKEVGFKKRKFNTANRRARTDD